MIAKTIAAVATAMVIAFSPVLQVSNDDIDLVAKIVYLEAGGEGADLQRAVTEVIYNRVLSGIWGDSVSEVIYATNDYGWEFSTVPDLYKAEPTDTTYEIVRDVFQKGSTIPLRIMYFRLNHYHQWAVDEFQIDNVYFSSSPWFQYE